MADIFFSSRTELLYMQVIHIRGSDALIPETNFYGHIKGEGIRGGGEMNTNWDWAKGGIALH